MKVFNKTKLISHRNRCFRDILNMHKNVNAGHVGSSLSCLDILVYLYFHKMKPQDKFILSKGHAATALYSVIVRSKKLPEAQLSSYYKDATLLAAHPPCTGNSLKIKNSPGRTPTAGQAKLKINKSIPFGTGSLGHGLSLATGIALSARYTGKKFDVYCLLSDGDLNEGSTWEAILFASHYNLNNLTIIVDKNDFQGFGKTKDILDVKPLEEKLRAFNLGVISIKDGHDFNQLHKAFSYPEKQGSKKPRTIVAKTIKGHGIPSIADSMESHYLPLTDEQYKEALNTMKDA